MKTSRQNEAGNVLMVTLIMAGVMGVTMASYLDLTSNQNRAVVRSQAYNSAMPMAEAGVEEALTYMNYCGATLCETNGWRLSNGRFAMARSLAGGHYSVGIDTNTVNGPTIYSSGFVPKPLSAGDLSRTVVVGTVGGYQFNRVLVARGGIDLGGGQTDSYNSGGTNGFVRGSTPLMGGGDVTSISSDVTGMAIFGKVSVSPGHSINVDYVGPYPGSGTTNYPGYDNYNVNATLPDPILPAGVGPGKGILLVAPILTSPIASGAYYTGTLGSLTVSGGAQVILYCTGINIQGSGVLAVTTNSSLTIYCNGPITLSGNAGSLGPARNMVIYGLPGCTSIALNGNANVTAAVYAPRADLTENGSGNSGFLAGSFIVNSANFHGNNTTFNYDEDLKKNGPKNNYKVASWSEQ